MRGIADHPLPVTVIGGFLGSGKTSLINALLRQSKGRRLAVLVNDFGSMSVDGAVISSNGGQMMDLPGGCVCCTIGDDLAARLVELADRAINFDHMLIEASGVAEPGAVADIVGLEPAYRLDGIIVLADGERVRGQAKAPYIADTVTRQIAAADLLIATRADLIGTQQKDELVDWLKTSAPGRPVVCMASHDVPESLIFGPIHHGHRHSGTPPEHHDRLFKHWSIEAQRPYRRAALLAAFADMPEGLLRAKGMVSLDNEPGRHYLLQAIGRKAELTPNPNRGIADVGLTKSRIIFIGLQHGCDIEAVGARLFEAQKG